jgi:hypothetical protein
MYCVLVSASGRVQSWCCNPSKKRLAADANFRREGFVVVLASERELSREDPAFLSLRPEDQCHGAHRRRAAVASFGKTEHWSHEDAFKDSQAANRRQRRLGRAQQSVVAYGENRGKEPGPSDSACGKFSPASSSESGHQPAAQRSSKRQGEKQWVSRCHKASRTRRVPSTPRASRPASVRDGRGSLAAIERGSP